MVLKQEGSANVSLPVSSSHVRHTYKIALVDDHVLLRKGLGELIKGFNNFDVLFEADNGNDFIAKLNHLSLPDAVLMDINMPIMDGYETAKWIKQHHPGIKVLALSMYDDEKAIIKMFKAGVKGYILKDSEPSELKEALMAVIVKGFYFSEMITGSLIHNINNRDEDDIQGKEAGCVTERETAFLKLVCTELTYKEIADNMCLSPRTIDGYRDALFHKLNVKTRVGLVIYAIKTGVVNL